MPRYQGRVRKLQVPTGLLAPQWLPDSYLTFWVAAPGSDAASRSLLGALLVEAVRHLQLAGRDLLAVAPPTSTPLTLRSGEQGSRVSLTVAVDAQQKKAALDLVEAATTHVRLPASAAQAALPGPVRLALDDRNLVRLHTSGWPPLVTEEQVKDALLQARPHSIAVVKAEQQQHGHLRLGGEFILTAFLPSRHPCDTWQVQSGNICATVQVRPCNGPAPPAAPPAGWQAAAAAAVGRRWPPRAPWAPATAGPPAAAAAAVPPAAATAAAAAAAPAAAAGGQAGAAWRAGVTIQSAVKGSQHLSLTRLNMLTVDRLEGSREYGRL